MFGRNMDLRARSGGSVNKEPIQEAEEMTPDNVGARRCPAT